MRWRNTVLLHERFVDVAKEHGNKLAIHDFSTNKKITFNRALLASILLSHIFSKLDKGFIGVMIPTSAGCMLTKLGLLMSGRIPVMVNYSTGAENNARFAQEKCAFKTIITSKTLLEKIECPHIDGMLYLEDIMANITLFQKAKAALISKLPAKWIQSLIHQGSEDDTLVILFTSGSEKDPKAVQLTHKNIAANLIAASHRYSFTSDDIFLASLPLFHVFGLTVNCWLPLMTGMTSLTYASPIEYKKICSIVREGKATFMVGTPSFFWGYLRKSSPGDFDSIRIMLCGADKCPDALREGFWTKHRITLLEAYGATETSPAISGNSPDHNKPGSVGQPFHNTQVRIEHLDTGEECKPGAEGKILVKSDCVMKGYLNNQEQTPQHLHDGWYDTGDMGYMDEDGYLWHVGRLKRFIKVGGEMVSLVKTETILEPLLPEGSECCVVEVPDKVKGAKLVAVVTQQLDEKETLKQMAEKLPQLALPKGFFIMEELPKMGSGKIDFRKITELTQAALSV